MKKVIFLVLVTMAMFSSCDFNRNEKQETNTYVNKVFVFDGSDTVVDGFTYVKYIPIDQVTPESKLITADYVRYHDSDTTGIVFTKDYIRNLCLSSRCVYHELQDSIYGLVREIYFPEAYLGFVYDEWEEMICYSFINFADDLWYSDLEDGITVTSDVETVLLGFLPYVSDSVQGFVNIYRYNEQSESKVEVDHVKTAYLNVWDIIRCFHNYGMYDGLKKYDENEKNYFVVYMNENGLSFIKSIEPNNQHLKSVHFAGYCIEDSTSLKLLESCFMDELNELPVRDDDFIEPYDPL